MAEGGFSVVDLELKLGRNCLDVLFFTGSLMFVFLDGFAFFSLSPHAPHAVWPSNQDYVTRGFHRGFDLLCHTTNSGTMFGIACLVLPLLQTLVALSFWDLSLSPKPRVIAGVVDDPRLSLSRQTL